MPATSKSNPFLGGFLTGLLVGVVLSLAVAYLVTRNNPFVAKDDVAPAPITVLPAKPAEAPVYGQKDQPAAATDDTGYGYFLQAGAFRNPAEADQLKARLALLGFEAKVNFAPNVASPVYRVQIGSFKAMDELNAARARLTENGIDTMLINKTYDAGQAAPSSQTAEQAPARIATPPSQQAPATTQEKP